MRRFKLGATGVATLAVAALAAPAGALAADHGDHDHRFDRGGAVYVQTNDPAGNAIVVYDRGRDGSLRKVAQVSTGGRGGTQASAPTDPLASQGSLVLDREDGLLFAVNAGSDTVSVLQADGTRVRLRQVVPSGGTFPTGVAVQDDRAYVLNAGNGGAVAGFRLNGEHLSALPNTSVPLGLTTDAVPFFLTSPGQIGLTPDGRTVLVTTKTKGVVESFAVARSGALSAGPQTATGPVPFAFVHDRAGRVVLADASGATNTFDRKPSGELVPHATSVNNGQAAQCWIVGARGFFYTTNTGSNSITGYAETAGGQLSLLSPDGVSATTDAGPIDLDATESGSVLYELNAAGTIGIYRVGRDGSLARTGTVTGLHPFDGANGPQGIAVAG